MSSLTNIALQSRRVFSIPAHYTLAAPIHNNLHISYVFAPSSTSLVLAKVFMIVVIPFGLPYAVLSHRTPQIVSVRHAKFPWVVRRARRKF
ncbi:hypothetical protein BD410DRAFT_138638 [Rickenella mellea]|uniref:Uncharacterized protein n=1 Tax=Rickenella mellea TaxID=50990 RepID=A0A4Y7PJ48_9AGAM|nr:hypothetical protein BD410DRAFT_138638 [Rickenella mellea]